MKIAEIGQTIKTESGIKGIVDKVTENSVVIDILVNPTDKEYGNQRTVVNHKNYTIIKATFQSKRTGSARH
ncbi:DUF2187 family protein [Bacillus toyonensis]|uniref:DUF2187 family protein n=1 Tax=Bacillus toyonensis TaxID=155322 RepID=UPI002E242E73|nr:DUF2187 family protein [Bacillus toyonensis]